MHSRASGFPLRAAADDRGAVAQAARLAEAVERAAGGHVLERGVVGLARGARRRAVGEVGGDDDVAELGCGARGPAVDAPVDDDAAAHTGPHGDHHERAGDEVEVVVMGLGERRDGRVVVDERGDAYPVAQQLTQRHALQRDVDRAARRAGCEVDHAGQPDADRVGRAGVLDGLDQLIDERIAARQDRRAQDRLGEHAVLEDGDRDLGASDIHPDQAIAHTPCTLATLYGPPVADDHALVERLKAGDEQAFMDLVVRWSPSLLRVARMYVPSAAVAEEVVQETWLAALQGLDRFEGRSSLRTWVFSILVNRARTRGERERRTIPFAALAREESEGEFAAVDAGSLRRRGQRRGRVGGAAGALVGGARARAGLRRGGRAHRGGDRQTARDAAPGHHHARRRGAVFRRGA